MTLRNFFLSIMHQKWDVFWMQSRLLTKLQELISLLLYLKWFTEFFIWLRTKLIQMYWGFIKWKIKILTWENWEELKVACFLLFLESSSSFQLFSYTKKTHAKECYTQTLCYSKLCWESNFHKFTKSVYLCS